jgi:hypothetical protein
MTTWNCRVFPKYAIRTGLRGKATGLWTLRLSTFGYWKILEQRLDAEFAAALPVGAGARHVGTLPVRPVRRGGR